MNTTSTKLSCGGSAPKRGPLTSGCLTSRLPWHWVVRFVVSVVMIGAGVLGSVRTVAGAPADASAACSRMLRELSEPLDPLEQSLLADAEDGRLDQFDLLSAAMVAAGATDRDQIARYMKIVADRAEELTRLTSSITNPEQRAEAVLEFLHRRILQGGYRLEATDLRVVIDTGRFNCVSATVLYNYLAGICGLRAVGLETTGHALSRIYVEDAVIDVETTCPIWFEIRHDPQRRSEALRAMAGSAVSRATPFREVSAIELTGMVFYNRGVDYLATKRFREAAAANAKALRLDPASKTARGNLLATLNNWAIIEGASQRYAEAASLLEQGLQLDPGFETLVQNYIHVYHQWSLSRCYRGDYQGAADLFCQAAFQPDRPQWRQMICDVYRRWARAMFDRGDIDGAFACFDEARRVLGTAGDVRHTEEEEVAAWRRELAEAQQWATAAAVERRARLRSSASVSFPSPADRDWGENSRSDTGELPAELLLDEMTPVVLVP